MGYFLLAVFVAGAVASGYKYRHFAAYPTPLPLGKRVMVGLAGVLGGFVFLTVALGVTSLFGRGTTPAAAPAARAPLVEQAEEPATPLLPLKPAHHYALKEGGEYGYEPALSDNDRQAGRVGSELLMFRFAGERNGVFQVYSRRGSVVVATECSKPCTFLKVYSFWGNEHVKTERMRAAPDMLLSLVMEDAMNGYLEPYAGKDGKSRPVWYGERGAG